MLLGSMATTQVGRFVSAIGISGPRTLTLARAVVAVSLAVPRVFPRRFVSLASRTFSLDPHRKEAGSAHNLQSRGHEIPASKPV